MLCGGTRSGKTAIREKNSIAQQMFPATMADSLTIGGRAEPKTLNPVIATDAVSREVIGRMMADLIEINRASQQTEPALAKSWKKSRRRPHIYSAVAQGHPFF